MKCDIENHKFCRCRFPYIGKATVYDRHKPREDLCGRTHAQECSTKVPHEKTTIVTYDQGS